MARRRPRTLTCKRPSCDRLVVLVNAHPEIARMLRLRARGYKQREIAAELGCAESTVRRHLRSPGEPKHGYCHLHEPATDCLAGGCSRKTRNASGYCWQHEEMAEAV